MRKSKSARNRAGVLGIISFVLSITFFTGLISTAVAQATQHQTASLSSACGRSPDRLSRLVLAEYGAHFAAAGPVALPPTCVFSSDEEVDNFQRKVKKASVFVGGVEIDLQAEAAASLKKAIDAAAARGLRITPLDGTIAGKRSFADTERIWNSRFLPALDYWVRRGKIDRNEAEKSRGMDTTEQVLQVLDWEKDGMFFSTGKNRPIMSSVAPPGTSQHLSLLAFDIEQAANRTIRQIMNSNGWFQTVVNDSPHFTYLGVEESELPKRGLKAVAKGGYTYWVPAL